MDAPRKFPEREEMSLQIADLIFVRLADIETEQIIPAVKDQLDRFHRLDRADDSGQNAKDAAFRAGRDKPRRGRFRIEAAVARAIRHAENSSLSFEAENRAVNIWFAEQDAGVVDEVASGKIVSPIDDDIKVLEKFESVSAG